MIGSFNVPQVDFVGVALKAFILIGLIIYLVLAIFLYFRVKILVKTLHTEHSDSVLRIAFIHMVVIAVIVLLLSFVLLV